MTPAAGLPAPLDAWAVGAGAWFGQGSHLGYVMLATAVAYPLLGFAGRRSRARSRDARAAREVEYVRPTLQGIALANGANRYEVEYSKAQPLVSVTLSFPEGRVSATCRDASYEEAILSALRLILAAREAGLAARADGGSGKDDAAVGGAAGPSSPPRPRGAIDDRTPWHEVLGLGKGAGRREVNAAFRRLAQVHHPDHGGSGEMMRHLVRARTEALAAR